MKTLTPSVPSGRLTPSILSGRLTPSVLSGCLTPSFLSGRLTPSVSGRLKVRNYDWGCFEYFLTSCLPSNEIFLMMWYFRAPLGNEIEWKYVQKHIRRFTNCKDIKEPEGLIMLLLSTLFRELLYQVPQYLLKEYYSWRHYLIFQHKGCFLIGKAMKQMNSQFLEQLNKEIIPYH